MPPKATATVPKKAKTDPRIKYQYRPHGDQYCDKCAMFRPPDTCTDVAGFIARTGWCKIYAPAKQTK